MVYKTYIFINNNFLSYKNWKQNWEFSNTAFIPLLWIKVLFLQKNADKIEGALVSKSQNTDGDWDFLIRYTIDSNKYAINSKFSLVN